MIGLPSSNIFNLGDLLKIWHLTGAEGQLAFVPNDVSTIPHYKGYLETEVKRLGVGTIVRVVGFSNDGDDNLELPQSVIVTTLDGKWRGWIWTDDLKELSPLEQLATTAEDTQRGIKQSDGSSAS